MLLCLLAILVSTQARSAGEVYIPDSHQQGELHPKLAMFQPYFGGWQANMGKNQQGEEMIDVSVWQRALNGNAVRTLHSINDGAYGGESLIFWDESEQKIKFYYFTTASFYTSGWMEITGDNQFTAFEDVTGSEQGITQVKSTSELSENEITISTSYLKNGEWTEPQVRKYVRSDRAVKFK
ncbi:hypothetical protein E8M12_01000 [Thalassotalea mangrovi]|uniref:DUF1579 domain-containing protein n=2 Tax=Thalassotalea mangrovi TaxID=2572245 RepID=A0A4U1BAJ5_9GAMM|nr:hypothetical protein E8M12_01000 [Thalassotalea mangrovi]